MKKLTKVVTAVAFAIAMATSATLVGWGPDSFRLTTYSSSSYSSLYASSSSSSSSSPSFQLEFKPVVVGTLQEEEEAAAAAAAKDAAAAKESAWPQVPFDYRKDSGDIVPPTEAVKRYFDRFDAVTRKPSTKSYTLTECREAAVHCGKACGSTREESESCWCVRIWKNSVSYLPKKDANGVGMDQWLLQPFGSLHMTLNLLWATLRTSPTGSPLQTTEFLEKPLYLVVNVYDYPRLFMPEPADPAVVPTVTLGHPAETRLGYEFFAQIAFEGGVPHNLEPCEGENVNAETCCNTTHHFPIFSWSVNPVYNFDILSPNRHAGSCHAKFMNDKIAQVPWHEKSRTVMYRGSDSCHTLQRGDHRGRFCGHVQSQRLYLENALNVTINIYGDHLEPAEQAKAQFIVLLDGAVAAFRSTWYLSTGSVILAAGTHVDMRTALLRPYVHYIPFRADYSDFADALALVARNDDYAQWVAENGRRAGRLLSEKQSDDKDGVVGVVDGGHDGDKMYWTQLLKEYHNRYEFVNDDKELDATFTMETACQDFRDSGESCRAFRDHCLGEEYACEEKIQDGFLLKETPVTFLDRKPADIAPPAPPPPPANVTY